LKKKVTFLENELKRLSSEHASGGLSVEQNYRRGCDYLFGTNGFGERGSRLSKRLVLDFLKQAADAGHEDAQYQYGMCVVEGCGCVADGDAGLAYLKLSAKSGNPFSQIAVAECFAKGLGTEQDLVGACGFYR
jgi:TPR repeat protein